MPEYTFKTVCLGSLSPKEIKTLSPLLQKEQLPLLEGKDPYRLERSELLGFIALLKERPIALAIAHIYSPTKEAELLSLFVTAKQRKLGVATQLLTFVEHELSQKKCQYIDFKFDSLAPSAKAFNKLLKKKKWSPPRSFMLRLHFDIPLFNPPWFKHPFPILAPFEEFFWSELSKKEREKLLKKEENLQLSPYLSPLVHEEIMEPNTSLGLRYKGEVIGWCVTHLVSPNTLRYSTLYIEPKFRYLGHAIKLLSHSIKYQQKTPIRWTFFEVNLDSTSPEWLQFTNKRLAPQAFRAELIHITFKNLD